VQGQPVGVKGAGQAGTIGARPSVMNAVIDALRRSCGSPGSNMPATPEVVWRTIQDATLKQAAE